MIIFHYVFDFHDIPCEIPVYAFPAAVVVILVIVAAAAAAVVVVVVVVVEAL